MKKLQKLNFLWDLGRFWNFQNWTYTPFFSRAAKFFGSYTLKMAKVGLRICREKRIPARISMYSRFSNTHIGISASSSKSVVLLYAAFENHRQDALYNCGWMCFAVCYWACVIVLVLHSLGCLFALLRKSAALSKIRTHWKQGLGGHNSESRSTHNAFDSPCPGDPGLLVKNLWVKNRSPCSLLYVPWEGFLVSNVL